MTSEAHPAGEGSSAADLQQQAGVKQEMPHSEAAMAAAAAAGSAEGPASGTTESGEPAPSTSSKVRQVPVGCPGHCYATAAAPPPPFRPAKRLFEKCGPVSLVTFSFMQQLAHDLPASLCLQRQRRVQKEMAALGFDGTIALDSGRPSRRAATAAQAAVAAAQAYEAQRGMDLGMSPPRPAEQSAAMRILEATAGHAHMALQAEQQAAAAAQQADGGADPPDAAGEENGRAAANKRKRADKPGPATASPTEDGSGGAAPASPAASGGAGASTPAVPPEPAKPVDMAPLIELARQCGSQEELRQRLQERYPATVRRQVVGEGPAGGSGCANLWGCMAAWLSGSLVHCCSLSLAHAVPAMPTLVNCSVSAALGCPCGAARALRQQQCVPRYLCHAVPRPSVQRAPPMPISMLLAVPVRCMLCLHAVVAQSASLLPALPLCLFTLPVHSPTHATAACLSLRPHSPSVLALHYTCRAGPACCRTCRTACSSWLASPWERRPRLTSLGGPRAPLARSGVRSWIPVLGRPPRQQRHQRRHQQQAAPAYQPGRRLGLLQSWGQHHLWRPPARLWGRLLLRQLGLQPQLRAPLWRPGLWSRHRRWQWCRQSEFAYNASVGLQLTLLGLLESLRCNCCDRAALGRAASRQHVLFHATSAILRT